MDLNELVWGLDKIMMCYQFIFILDISGAIPAPDMMYVSHNYKKE